MNTQLFVAKDAGHAYDLINHDGVDAQTILFIKKEPIEDSTEMRVVQQGTTNEAVISMLIDRLQTLDEKFPSEYNKHAIKHLHLVYETLIARTQERQSRGVEGTHQQ